MDIRERRRQKGLGFRASKFFSRGYIGIHSGIYQDSEMGVVGVPETMARCLRSL